VFTVQPDPANFNIPGPELQVVPNRMRLADVGLTPADLGLAVQAGGDGAIIGEYHVGGEAIDLKVIANSAVDQKYITNIGDVPIATPSGLVVPLSSLASLNRVSSPPQINRVNRQRSVTLQFTPPSAMPLESAIHDVDTMLGELRAAGAIPPDVETGFTGSASKLKAVQNALLGDGTWLGTLSSTLVLALLVTYLLLCVLFQSWLQPMVIMFSVPLATLGGFAALRLVYLWSQADRYMPVQKLDVLTMLGFVILIGVVVKNAILIVHQALNFIKGISDVENIQGPLTPRRAIAESVRTRLRPIMMSSLTSVLGMAPLVLMPGAGSELYRGLGAVVLGGLLVSTVFTLVLVPLLMSLVIDIQSLFQQKIWPSAAVYQLSSNGSLESHKPQEMQASAQSQSAGSTAQSPSGAGHR
jgi:HAE1 family hydrophobic/amphiphilic exporter-1